jgi:hypothetical protein
MVLERIKNKKKILEAVNRFIYTTKYENNSGLIDIFTFIAKVPRFMVSALQSSAPLEGG